jgi:hypothetical protein
VERRVIFHDLITLDEAVDALLRSVGLRPMAETVKGCHLADVPAVGFGCFPPEAGR